MYSTLFKRKDTFGAVLRNISWLASDKLLDWCIMLAMGVWMARYLGPEALGELSYSIAFVALFAPFAQLGMTTIVIRSIVESTDDANEILGTSFILQLLTGFAAGIFATYFVWVVRPADGLIPWFVALLSWTLIFRSTDIFRWWNQSQVASKYSVWANRTGILVAVVIKASLILLRAPVAIFIWAWVAQSLTAAILLTYLYQRNFGSVLKFRFLLERARNLIANSWPLIFSGIASVIYLKIDKIMLGNMVGSYEVGIYSAASRLSELWYFVPTIVIGSLFPSIIRLKSSGSTEYHGRIQALFDFMALYGLGTAAVLTLLATPLIGTLYGESYLDAAPILKVHSWALIFVATGVARNRWFIAENWTRFIMAATVIGAAANIILNLVLIPQFAGLGAAWATILSYGISTYIACALWRPMWPSFRMLSKSYLVPLRPQALYFELVSLTKKRI